MSKRFFLGIWLGFAVSAAANAKVYDFEFKEMDFKKAVESVAQLDGKHVVFSPAVATKPITLSLGQVAPAFALKLLLENYGYLAVEKGEVLHIMTQTERGPASTPTMIYPLENVLAKELLPNITAFLGAAGRATANEQRNALIVSAPEDTLRELTALIAELDRESNQVFIEGKIIETSTTFSRNLGIQWGVLNGNGSPMGTMQAPATDTAATANFVTGLAGARLVAQLTAGERNGELKVISSPKVTTLNGMPANIESLTTFNIRTLQNSATVAGQPQVVGTLEQVKAGVSLRVTPYIVSSKQVRLNIAMSKSEPNFARSVDGIPGIADNSATTSLVVTSGETATIGGLIYNSDTDNSLSMPFLANMPILGLIFGNSEKRKEDRELLIFITPTIFKGRRPGVGVETGELEPAEATDGAAASDRTGRVMIKPTSTDYSGMAKSIRPLRQPAEKVVFEGKVKPAEELESVLPPPAPGAPVEKTLPAAAK